MGNDAKIWSYFYSDITRCFHSMLEGIVILDRNQRLLYANPAFLNYSHLNYEKSLGRPWAELRPGAISPKVFEEKKAVYNCHRVLDDEVESYVDIIPFCEEGEVLGALIVVRDIRTLRSLMQRVQDKESYISRLNERVKSFYKARYTFADVIGGDDPYIYLAKKAAQTDKSVLLIGESGTGKEVLAQSIHQGSYRGGQPFVDVNCAALPESLLESELFGYVPGAFTGASKNGKTGLFELANGGTLFLDEITEMPMPLQGKLLRVLQEQQIRRLGDNKNIKINVRIIAATNRDVKKAMEENVFRQDLFYRMAIAIQIPPLRERKKDLDLYINYFLQPLERQYNRHFQLSKEARQIMHNYRWPGNVRELQNVLEYCCMVTPTDRIMPPSLPDYVRTGMEEHQRRDWPSLAQPGETLEETMNRVEGSILCEMLRHYGTSTAAKKNIAKALGISLSTFYNKLKKMDPEERENTDC